METILNAPMKANRLPLLVGITLQASQVKLYLMGGFVPQMTYPNGKTRRRLGAGNPPKSAGLTAPP